MHIANVFTLGFSLGCAWSPTVGSLIAFRFLSKILFKLCSTFVTDDRSAGFSGSAPIAIGGGVVGDLFSERDRASAMALFSLGPLLGMLDYVSCSFGYNSY